MAPDTWICHVSQVEKVYIDVGFSIAPLSVSRERFIFGIRTGSTFLCFDIYTFHSSSRVFELFGSGQFC